MRSVWNTLPSIFRLICFSCFEILNFFGKIGLGFYVLVGAVFLSGLQIRPARPQDLRPALAQARPGLHLKSLSAGRDFGGPASCRPAGPGHLGTLGGSRLALFLGTVLYARAHVFMVYAAAFEYQDILIFPTMNLRR
jgi:hypothetical protein